MNNWVSFNKREKDKKAANDTLNQIRENLHLLLDADIVEEFKYAEVSKSGPPVVYFPTVKREETIKEESKMILLKLAYVFISASNIYHYISSFITIKEYKFESSYFKVLFKLKDNVTKEEKQWWNFIVF